MKECSLKDVIIKDFEDDGCKYIKIIGKQKIDGQYSQIELDKINVNTLELIRNSDGNITHVQFPIGNKNDTVGKIFRPVCDKINKGVVNDMKSIQVKIKSGEVVQKGNMVEIPLYANDKFIKTIVVKITDDGKYKLLNEEEKEAYEIKEMKELITELGFKFNGSENFLDWINNLSSKKKEETRLKPYVSEITFENGVNEVTIKTVKKQIEAKVGNTEYILIEFLDAYEGIDKILEGKFGVVLKDVVTNDAVQFIDEECRIKSGFKLIKGFTIKDSDVTSDSCNRTIVICNESGDITEFNNAEADKLIAMSRR